MHKSALAISFLAASIIQELNAQEKSESQTLETHTIYATRTQDSFKETPASVTVLDRAAIDRIDAPGQNLGTLLGKALPGFGAPTQSVSNFGQTLRGRDVIILIDGIPQMENRQISRQLNNIKVESIERIEVISGASAIYGAGASGGIINILTKAYTQEPLSFESYLGTSVAGRPLSNASQIYNFQQSVSGRAANFQYLASIGGEWRHNSFDSNGNLIPPEPAQTSRGDTDTYEGLLKLRYNLSNASFTEASVETFQEQQDTDYAVQLNPYRAEKGLELDEQPSSKRSQYAINFQNSQFFGQKLSVLAYYRNRELIFFPFALTVPVPLVNQSRTEADVYGLKAIVQSTLPMNIEMAWGLDLELNKGNEKAHSYSQLRYDTSSAKSYTDKSADYDYGPSVDTKATALFTQFKTKFYDDLHAKFGLRFEHIEQKVHDFTPPLETAIASNWPVLYAGIARREAAGRLPAGTTASLPKSLIAENFDGGTLDYDAWATNLGFSYDITPRQIAFINFSQGYELGDTARLMRDAVSRNSLIPKISPIFGLAIDSTTVSALDLQAIKTNSYELGWRGSAGKLSGDATLFYNESNKVYQFNPDFTVDLLDRKKRIYGLEASLSARATDSINVGISHARAKGEAQRVEGSGWAALSGLEVSPPKSAAYIDYTYDSSLRMNLQAQHIASYNKEDDLNPKDTKGALDLAEYFVMDGSLNYGFSENSSLKFAVTNLLNRNYQTLFHQWARYTYGEASGAPAEGRRLSLIYRHMY